MKKVREGYKITELGEIPIDWDSKNLKQVCYIKGRIGWQGLRQEEFTEEGPYLITGVNFDRGRIVWDECYHITEERYNEAKEIQLEVGDVLMTKDGTIGKLLYVENLPDKASLNSHLFVMRPYNNSFLPKYLYYHLDSEYFKKYVRKNQTGSTIPAITQEAMERYSLILPPIEEQQKISLILSSVDEQIEITDSLIEKTKELKKGLMQRLLTKGIGHERFKDTEIGRIPEEWEVCSLKELSERIIVGLATSVTKYYREIGTPIIRNMNIKKGYFDGGDMLYLDPVFAQEQSSKQVKTDDVLTVHTGSNLGLSCLVPEEYNLSQTFTTLITTTKLNKLLPQYLVQHLNSNIGVSEIDRLQVGGGKNNLNVKDFENYRIALPPIEEQNGISNLLFNLDDNMFQYESKKEKLQELKRGLMQKLLTGKIRVKV